jgi:hypothetical protein
MRFIPTRQKFRAVEKLQKKKRRTLQGQGISSTRCCARLPAKLFSNACAILITNRPQLSRPHGMKEKQFHSNRS